MNFIFDFNKKKFVNIKVYNQPRRADQCVYITDISKVSNTFNWTPKVNIETGYTEIINWVKDNKSILERLYK